MAKKIVVWSALRILRRAGGDQLIRWNAALMPKSAAIDTT